MTTPLHCCFYSNSQSKISPPSLLEKALEINCNFGKWLKPQSILELPKAIKSLSENNKALLKNLVSAHEKSTTPMGQKLSAEDLFTWALSLHDCQIMQNELPKEFSTYKGGDKPNELLFTLRRLSATSQNKIDLTSIEDGEPEALLEEIYLEAINNGDLDIAAYLREICQFKTVPKKRKSEEINSDPEKPSLLLAAIPDEPIPKLTKTEDSALLLLLSNRE